MIFVLGVFEHAIYLRVAYTLVRAPIFWLNVECEVVERFVVVVV